MSKIIKECPECKGLFSGRCNALFCSDACRASVRKRKLGAARESMRAGGKFFGMEPLDYHYGLRKREARRKGAGFPLTRGQYALLFNGPCRFCGFPVEHGGIARMDGSLPWDASNTVPACSACALMSRGMDGDAFVRKCIEIANNMGGKP